MQPIHTEKHGEYTIKIFQDIDASNPREEFDHLGTIFHVNREYDLGEQLDGDAIKAIIDDPEYISIPLYMYEHGGIALSTSNGSYPFNCPWDGGQVGIIAVKKSKALKEFGKKRWSKKLESQVVQSLRSEVKEFSEYLEGNVYGFVIEKTKHCEACGNDEPEHVDSCWGFIGDYEYCLSEAKSALPSEAKSA